MKARKKLAALAAVMVLTVSSITINAIPALADEAEERVQVEIQENAVTEAAEVKAEETESIETERIEPDHIQSDSTETDQVENNDAETESSYGGNPGIVKSNAETRNWNKYEPCNELEISEDKLSGSIIAGKMTKHQPVVIWSKEPLSEDEQKAVWESLKGNPGVGNPSGVVYISGDGANSYGMTVNTTTGKITFDNKSNWSLLYAGEYVRDNPQDSTPDTGNTETVPEEKPELLPENDPENIPDYIPPQDPEPEKGPGVDVTEEPENKQETEEHIETPGDSSSESTAGDGSSVNDTVPSGSDSTSVNDTAASGSDSSSANNTVLSGSSYDHSNTVSDSGSSSGSVYVSSGGRSLSGSSVGGPGAVHELDDVPETGPIDGLKGRVLDNVPKTGMPEDFAILMAVSVVALVLLTVVLVTERKKERQNNRLNR